MMKELDTAFKKKKKKARKQEKNLDEKQKEIENLEKKLRVYIATGQHDKIDELQRLLDEHNQRN